ncbi:MAG: hypothetical protein KC619_20705 [Myxococcales bacterium]|nr:hypothetical protein [Myxococcales bacterium]
MTARAIAAGVLALAVLAAPAARAQTVRFDVGATPAFEVLAGSGFDDAVAPLELRGAVALAVEDRPLVIGVSLTSPLLEPGIDDFVFETFAEYDLHEDFGWTVRPRLSLAVPTTSNEVFSATGLDVGVGLFGGWSDPIWTLGAEVVGHLGVLSHLRASEWGREYGSLASDAILAGNGYRLEVGARAGLLLGPVEIALRAGWRRRGDYSESPPVYAMLSVGVRWQ